MICLSLLGASINAQDTLSEQAARIHDRVWTVDTHVDTPMSLERGYDLGIRNERGSRRGGLVDFPRMKEGGLDAIFFAIFLGQPRVGAEDYPAARAQTLKTFDLIDRELDRLSGLAVRATASQEALSIEKSGKRAVFIGIENGYPVGDDPGMVETFYQRGARYITLCHTAHNQLCDSSTDSHPPRHNGLSPLGRQVVAEMNRLGMMVDISHTSDKTVEDVLECSTAPVLASHSSVRAVCDIPRNLSDPLIRKIAQKGGVVQICLLSAYVKDIPQDERRVAAEKNLRSAFSRYETLTPDEREKLRNQWEELERLYPRKMATVSDLVDHIDHVVKLVGVDYVGIGSDFDGGGGLADCRDVSDFPRITEELLRRGYTEEDIEKIWGGNLLRVFRAVEARRSAARNETAGVSRDGAKPAKSSQEKEQPGAAWEENNREP